MWLSRQFCTPLPTETALFGEVTLSAPQAAARSAGREQRLLPLVSPGGLSWLPNPGEQVLVLREGSCILGTIQQEADLCPGEVCLHAGSASILLQPDGTIQITGNVYVNGAALGGG